MTIRQTFSCGLVLLAGVGQISAQEVVHIHTVPGWTQEFGVSLATLGDLDGDTLPELAIGQAPVFGNGTPTRVAIMHGGDGAVLRTFDAPTNAEHFGLALARIADLDGDGGSDLLIGAPGRPGDPLATTLVEVRATGTGALIVTVFGAAGSGFGTALTDLGDLNGDGFADFAVGAPTGTVALAGEGTVTVISGMDGLDLYTLSGGLAGAELGRSLASLPDQDGDGLRELLVGVPGANQARIYSGANGALLRTFVGPSGSASFGFSVDAIGDLDGDTFTDIIVGDPRRPGFSGNEVGYAWVLSNASGFSLYGHPGGLWGDYLGYSVAGTKDLDADGIEDYLIGAPLLGSSSFYPAGFVRAHSGADGSVLFSAIGPSSTSAGGFAVADLGDFDGDGFNDIAMSAPGASKVQVIRTEGLLGTPFCTGDGSGLICPCGNLNDGSVSGGAAGCANSSGPGGANLAATGSTSVGDADLALVARGLIPGATGLYFQGSLKANGGLGVLLGDGFLCAGGNIQRLQIVNSGATGLSSTNIDLVQAGGVQLGDTLYYQLWYRDPNSSPCSTGFNLTNGLQVDWGI